MFQVLFLLCLIWGFNFVAMKVAADFFSPELFVTYRFGLGAVVLLFYKTAVAAEKTLGLDNFNGRISNFNRRGDSAKLF